MNNNNIPLNVLSNQQINQMDQVEEIARMINASGANRAQRLKSLYVIQLNCQRRQ